MARRFEWTSVWPLQLRVLTAATVVGFSLTAWGATPGEADAPYSAPASPRATYRFDGGWRFIRQDVPGGQAVELDDAHWDAVSTPHTFNDVDTFHRIISHSGGQQGQ